MSKILENEIFEAALLRISKGDLSPLELIYERFGKLLFSIAFSLLENRQEAEDVLQETFIKISYNASKYRKGENSSVKAWLVTICRNLSLDRLRHIKMQQEQMPIFHTGSASEKVEADISFLQMISVLDEEEKQIVIFKSIWSLKHQEIARVLDISTENSRQKYKRAIHKMRRNQISDEKSTN